MNMLDAMGLVAAVIPVAIGVGLLWFLGGMPGRVAAKNNHPDVAAIKVGGWASLILGVVGYPWVLMWAHKKNGATVESAGELARLTERVTELESRLNAGKTDDQADDQTEANPEEKSSDD